MTPLKRITAAIAVASLFFLLINFPLVTIVNRVDFFLGFPILYFYIFSLWFLFILCIFIIYRRYE